jgi:hypothetical protein
MTRYLHQSKNMSMRKVCGGCVSISSDVRAATRVFPQTIRWATTCWQVPSPELPYETPAATKAIRMADVCFRSIR